MTDQGNDLALGKVLGAHEARLSALETRMISLETDLKQQLSGIHQSLNDLHANVATVRGGWKVLAVIGAIATTLAGFAIAIARWWKG